MKARTATTLLHLAGPMAGNEIRKLIRELARLYGVARVAPAATFSRLLSIDYDPTAIAPRTLVAHVRRNWVTSQLVSV